MSGKVLLVLLLMLSTFFSFADRDRRVSVEEMKSEIRRQWDSSDEMIFRSYKINADLADLLMAHHADDSGDSVSVEAFFSDITFAEGSSAMFMPAFNSLFVQQTSANIARVEALLKSYQREQRQLENEQIEIEVKLMEVSQNTLSELGFDWTFTEHKGGALQVMDDLFFKNTPTGSFFDNVNPPGTGGQSLFGSGLRTAAAALNAGSASSLAISKVAGDFQWDLVINALEQAGDSEVLSAPRVVALDGSTAVIQVGEERMVPKAFEVNNQDTSPYVEHTDWDLELMGVYMEVTPELRDEGLIDLELHPRVMDVIGYDRYELIPAYSYDEVYVSNGGIQSDGTTADIPIEALEAGLPYFRVRELETRVTVADGNTIGMGGLIYDKSEQFKDAVPLLGKIPFLGRFFRSEGSRSVKRNLMIFVKASTVNLDGETVADLALSE